MLNNVNTNVERIIAKIDNDFNPDNSDWIPRVGAWCIDAMAQLNVFNVERKRKKYAVFNRMVHTECPLDGKNIKVYDRNNCEIKKANKECVACDSPSTGEFSKTNNNISISNTAVIVNNDKTIPPEYVIGETVNSHNPYDVVVRNYKNNNNIINDRNYVIANNNIIELNFDTEYIIIEQDFIKTEYSETFDCEMPVIPNNGLLIEAIVYYCMYKMLCRGYKHPVFNLAASQYGTNPYYIWLNAKESAKRSVIIDGFDEDSSKLFRSNMFINMFDNRNK